MKLMPGNGQFNEIASLVSPTLPDTAVKCKMTFWYINQVRHLIDLSVQNEMREFQSTDSKQGTSGLRLCGLTSTELQQNGAVHLRPFVSGITISPYMYILLLAYNWKNIEPAFINKISEN